MNRDTQFAGFAKWLFDELPDGINLDAVFDGYDEWAKACETIVAQRAYDLVKHTLNTVPHLLEIAEQAKTVEEVIVYVPDIVKSSGVSE